MVVWNYCDGLLRLSWHGYGNLRLWKKAGAADSASLGLSPSDINGRTNAWACRLICFRDQPPDGYHSSLTPTSISILLYDFFITHICMNSAPKFYRVLMFVVVFFFCQTMMHCHKSSIVILVPFATRTSHKIEICNVKHCLASIWRQTSKSNET